LLGTRHYTIAVRAPAMVAAAARFTEVHGEPFGDAAALPLTVLAHEASQELKVVLTGEGADELVGGYARYRVSSWLGHSPFTAAPLATWWGRRRGDRPWERAAEAVAWGGGPRSHAALLGSDLTTLVDAGAPFASDIGSGMRAEWLAGPARRGRSDREVARSLDRERLANTYLEKTDRATMACSLEARVPYLDPALAKAFAGAPVDTHKSRLRAELARRLPGAVLPSRKKGLAVNLEELLDGGLAAHLYYELGSSRSVLGSVLGPEPVRALRERCERSALSSYRIAMLGQWETTLASSGLLAGVAGTPAPVGTSPH
jgi:asparagine synthase (glutamine-hydrolysing)